MPDLAVANLDSSSVSVLLGVGDGSFATERQFRVGGGGPLWLAAGDFNGDRLLDLAVANYSNDVSILINNTP